ncbi:MAG: hypothetical protein HY833_03120 [Candidatus Aenigmarchaeota archaeon]|nr:hypothetical protein [Candidatus Aenigmarchaeota archaeon]
MRHKKKIMDKHVQIAAFAIVVFSALAAAYLYSVETYSPDKGDEMFVTDEPGSLETGGPIHWHPNLRIFIEDEEQEVPAGIGIIIGNVIDTDVSGMKMSPMHTHSDDGVIHMEQTSPTNRTLRLGYFFLVWGEGFNSTCIFSFCNSDDKVVKMTVNGEQNREFDGYIPQDKDEIVIRYEREMFGS